jgi:hypothetical protein
MGTDTISDFNGSLSFADLEIIQRGSSTVISIVSTEETLVSLLRTNAALITEADFADFIAV